MIVKYIYDVVYDTLELLEEGGHTYSMDANQIYKDLVEQGKIINYSYVLNKETLTRTATITYKNIDAYQEHMNQFDAINDKTVVTGRSIASYYLEDEFGIRLQV